MIIIDASVAFKWFKSKDEPYHKEAILILQEHLSDRNKILVPNILFVEIANSLVTKTNTTEATVRTDLNSLYKFDLHVYIPESIDIIRAAKLAKQNSTSVYDMLYAVVAQKHNTILITTDERFVKRTKFPFVKLLSEYLP